MSGRALAGAAFALALSGCATLTQPGPGGTLTGKLIVQWAGQSPERGVGFRHGLCCASWAALRRARLAMASKATKRPLIEHFSALKDRRQIWKVVYPLPEIMLLVLCATLAGAEDFVEVRLWGCENLDFLRRFLPFNDGLPSHDYLRGDLPATGQGRSPGPAPMRHAGHEPASGGSRTSRGSRSPWGHADGPGRMAPRQGPCRARQSHTGAAASPSARIEPG